MQTSTAEKLRKYWGDAFCYHPLLDKEYESDKYTGNYVCLICGKTVTEEKHKNFTDEKKVQDLQ